MTLRRLLPLVLILAGCSNPPETTEVPFSTDATALPAEVFIGEATAREWLLWAFIDEYGLPVTQERDGDLLMLYDCRDASVALTIDREKFDQGILDVIEGEAY